MEYSNSSSCRLTACTSEGCSFTHIYTYHLTSLTSQNYYLYKLTSSTVRKRDLSHSTRCKQSMYLVVQTIINNKNRNIMNKLTINYRGQSLTMHATKENLKELVNKGTELLLGDHLEYSSEHELGNMNINEGNIYVSYLIGVLKEKLSVEYKGSLSAHELMLIFIN